MHSSPVWAPLEQAFPSRRTPGVFPMTVISQAARLRARLYRIADGYAATRRDLAREYTRICPRDASAWASLSSALIDLGLYSKARVALRRLENLGRDENPYLVCVRWAEYYYAIGDLKRAERWYRKAARAAPAALVFLGAVLARQGRLAQGLTIASRFSGACFTSRRRISSARS